MAFAHFRYDMDYDDEVLYVYEIQGWVAHKTACICELYESHSVLLSLSLATFD